MLHTHSHLIVGAVTGIGPSQDSPDFIPAMRQAASIMAFGTVLADAGYDAEHNHRLCREELGISQIVWSPVAQGVLTGKYLPGQPAPAGSRATDEKGGANMISRFMTDEVLTRVQKLRPIADDLGITMAQLAVAWVLANDNVAGAIIGASRPEQVVDNARAVDVTLDAATLAAIDEALGDAVQADPSLTQANAPAVRPA